MKAKRIKIMKNVEVEDGDVFIKIDPEYSLEAKKDLLEITEATIEMQIAAENFKQKRREEEARRHDAKRASKELQNALHSMLSELPKEIKIRIREEKREPSRIEKPKEIPAEKKAPETKIPVRKEEIRPTKMSDLQKELDNIKAKLSGM
jgi:hypothetical protein